MIIISLCLWFFLPLLSPSSLLTNIADIPVLAILLCQKKWTWARYAALLSLWNTPLDFESCFFIMPLIRLLSVDLCQLLTKTVMLEPFACACISSSILTGVEQIMSCLLLPFILPETFLKSIEWNTKLFLFSTVMATVLTSCLFVVRYFKMLIIQRQRI